MATKRVFLGNIKGPKGDPYILTEEDKNIIVEELKTYMFPEVWRFVDDNENVTDRMVYVRPEGNDNVTFILEDETSVEKGVDI